MNPNVIKLFMLVAEINQYELAELLGVHQTAVSGWLTRKRGMSDANVSKLVAIIGEQNVRMLNDLCNSLSEWQEESIKQKFETERGGR
ncbi:helix-turn-helix transcriptional regulator [Bacillus pacificus]|uniref:helix-turn-helix domain-containing protein n=1 Tax=Bacillus pacificus TaxID=2026187 RepID=UPI002E1A0E33|nr:helix-turn-helix transcriptional regulator [Bacillus pacificus]